jgi:hypothetical protein
VAEIKGKTSKPPTAATVTVPVSGPQTAASGVNGTWWVIFDTRPGQAADRVVESATRPPGKPGELVEGPFPTKAAADAAAAPGKRPTGNPSIPNPLSGIGAVGHWIGAAVEHLTDGAMWRSLGWLALGGILVIAGIYLWFRTSSTYKSLESSVTGAAKAL